MAVLPLFKTAYSFCLNPKSPITRNILKMQRLSSFLISHNYANKHFCSFFSSLSETPNSNSILFNFLIETLGFPNSRALLISNKYRYVKSLEKPQTVRQFFHNVGFSDNQIQSTVSVSPRVLFSDVEKILRPKIDFFQHLGLVGSDLGKFISKNPLLLSVSLENKLVPCVAILKKILVNDTNNVDFIRTVCRHNWILKKDPKESGLLRNIEYLKSCGIVESQLSMLLVRQPRIFHLQDSKIRDLVSRVLEMGFSTNSMMFVVGMYTLSYMSEETFDRKLELLRSYGFSKEDFLEMFRRAPVFLGASEKKLKSGLEFFLKTIECEKEELVRAPLCLKFSMENRVIPRYKIFKIVKSKKLLKKEWGFPQLLGLSEERFLEKFLPSCGDVAEELLIAYKGQKLSSSSKEES